VPSVTGALWIDHLDLNPYLQVAGKRSPKPTHPSEPGWSKAPINVAWLKEADADLSLDVGQLRLRNLRLGHSHAHLTLKDGALAARLDSVSLYGGTGRAQLTVDGRSAVLLFRNTLQFDRVTLRPFLTDTLGLDRIEGTGSLSLDVAAQGANADAVMHTLSGKGSITVGQGRIQGVDLGTVARTIQKFLGSGATGEVANTDFHDMGGSFVMAHGVLTNRDFHLAGPVLQAVGAGDIDIGNRSLDFRVEPKAGVGGARGPSIGIPFRIKGSWDHVHYVPDLAGIVNGVIQNLESGRAPFKGLFGGGNKSHDQDGAKKKKKSTGDILKNMLGIH
jgi:AsmA protein